MAKRSHERGGRRSPRSNSRRRTDGPLISPELLREAVTFADEHGAPLLHRLRPPVTDEDVILAFTPGQCDTYQLSTDDVDAVEVPRRLHLEWLREELMAGSEGKHIDDLERKLGDAYVEALRDRVAQRGGRVLDERTFAKVYDGPEMGTEAELAAWLNEKIDFDVVTGLEWEARNVYLRGRSATYGAMLGAVELCKPYMPWRDPDTGAVVGAIAPIASMCADGTLEATSHVALTCFQWTCDLLGLGIRVEIREY